MQRLIQPISAAQLRNGLLGDERVALERRQGVASGSREQRERQSRDEQQNYQPL